MSAEEQTPPAGVSANDFARFVDRETRAIGAKSARRGDGLTWDEVLAQLSTLPPLTPEEHALAEKRRAESEQVERLARFRRVCPPEFMQKIDRTKITHLQSFDAVAQWNGAFPGPLAFGRTGSAKTRAAWSVLCRLYVTQGRSFAWFPVKRLITELKRYEEKDIADEFWRMYRGFNALFVDDLDKINWQFESEGAMLFQFYDWAYRENIRVITTTNKGRQWWAEKMGDAFARRLFDEAHFSVCFA